MQNRETHRAMTPKEEESVYDLLRVIMRSPLCTMAVLEDLLKLSQVADGDSEVFESAVIGSRPGREKARLSASGVKECMTELAHYVDKRPVIEAAMAVISSIQTKADHLDSRKEEIAGIFRGLDVRTRAILKVQAELSAVDGVVNTTLCEAVHDVGEVDVEASLGGDAQLRSLVELYTIAREVNEYGQRVW
jgi:hypothetical protein